ncbi:hypothetical protein PPL_10209 [Heterostelium album PN500]|uniref:WD40 repeat-containing protein n=1 Tax=Heterostelium pallidum (strain ATCC 26659 / Pp 5 / PN500) TaxID=670386 RepID=D3BQM4_HETP5|nr:hypothetical protein PPL_10209 [Heterostelium album PN500]EFA76444.1 hypothetical protein PPL_10209 [Heterostelium album PN500]|eukprot:XP_020428576.1 hypothetical protein PPL_10209 [Heterostelium album PN500]
MKRKESNEIVGTYVQTVKQYEEISNALTRLFFSREVWGYDFKSTELLAIDSTPKETTTTTTTTTTTSSSSSSSSSTASASTNSNSNSNINITNSNANTNTNTNINGRRSGTRTSAATSKSNEDNDDLINIVDTSSPPSSSSSSTTTITTTSSSSPSTINKKPAKIAKPKPLKFKGWTRLGRKSARVINVYKKTKSLNGTLLKNPINELFSSPLPNINELTVFQLSYLEETLAVLKQQLGIPRDITISTSNYIKQNYDFIKSYINSQMPKAISDSMAKSLPGRVPIDCMRFLEDFDCGKHISTAIIYSKPVKEKSVQSILMEREFGKIRQPIYTNKDLMAKQFEDFGLHSSYNSRGSIVYDVKIDPTGKTNKILAMTEQDSTLFDIDKGEIKKLVFHHATCNEGHFSNDGEELLTSGEDGSVAIWNASTAELLHHHKVPNDQIVRMAVHPQEPFLAAATNRKSFFVINYKNFNVVNLHGALKTSEWPATIADMAFGYDSYRHYLLAGICSNALYSYAPIKGFSVLVDCNKPETFRKLTDQDGEINTVSWNPKQFTNFVCGSTDLKKSLCIYDIRKNAPIEFLKTKQVDPNHLAWSPCGVHLSSSGDSNSVFVYDIRFSSRPLHVLKHYGDHTTNGMVNVGKWTKQGNFLVTCGDDCTVRIWDISRGDPLIKSLRSHTGSVNYVDVSVNSDFIVSGGDDSVVNLYSTTKNVQLEATKVAES